MICSAEGSGKAGDEAIKQLNADYQIYKTVEQQLLHRKTRLLAKLPDLQRALDMVNMLKEKSGDEVSCMKGHIGHVAIAWSVQDVCVLLLLTKL